MNLQNLEMLKKNNEKMKQKLKFYEASLNEKSQNKLNKSNNNRSCFLVS